MQWLLFDGYVWESDMQWLLFDNHVWESDVHRLLVDSHVQLIMNAFIHYNIESSSEATDLVVFFWKLLNLTFNAIDKPVSIWVFAVAWQRQRLDTYMLKRREKTVSNCKVIAMKSTALQAVFRMKVQPWLLVITGMYSKSNLT